MRSPRSFVSHTPEPRVLRHEQDRAEPRDPVKLAEHAAVVVDVFEHVEQRHDRGAAVRQFDPFERGL